jgi:hypothetical protein
MPLSQEHVLVLRPTYFRSPVDRASSWASSTPRMLRDGAAAGYAGPVAHGRCRQFDDREPSDEARGRSVCPDDHSYRHVRHCRLNASGMASVPLTTSIGVSRDLQRGQTKSSSVLTISPTSQWNDRRPARLSRRCRVHDNDAHRWTQAGLYRSVLAFPHYLEGVGPSQCRRSQEAGPVPRSREPAPIPNPVWEQCRRGDQSTQGLGGTVDEITKATKSEVGR